MRLGPQSSFHYAIDSDAGLSYAKMIGALTGADMVRLVQVVHGDPAWRHHFDSIWDCSLVSAHVVLPSEVTPLVREVTDGETGQDMLIESEGLAASFFSRLLALRCQASGKEVHACHSLEEALDTLGLSALPASLRHVQAVGADLTSAS